MARAISVQKFDGNNVQQKTRQYEFDMFWKEFESIEPTIREKQDEDDEPLNELEQDVEWLKEAGFNAVVNRYRDSKEINVNDAVVNNITSSLTRKQAEAVKRRINKLNQSVKQRLNSQETTAAPVIVTPDNGARQRTGQYRDIRSIFPTQTVGEASHQEPVLHQRRSYSEGVPVVSSQVKTSARSCRSKSQENINRITGSPVRVITSGSNIQAKPNKLNAVGSLTPSPRMKRASNAYMAQLTGKSLTGNESSRTPPQGGKPNTSKASSKKLGGSLFYITAVNNNSPSSTPGQSPVQDMQNLSINDGWEISERKESPSQPELKYTMNPVAEDQGFSPSNHEEIDEIFKEIPTVTTEKPIIGNPKPERKPEEMVEAASAPKFPALPNFTLSKDVYGITRIDDLSDADMEKVRSLALIELTALFDSANLVFNRRKPTKRKSKENGVFGVSLTTLIQQDRGDNPKFNTPVILEEMVAFLEENGIQEEGILRVPGSAVRIRGMREEIEEKYQDRLFMWKGRKPHDVAALLKQFLRELPFPLLTYEYQPTFASIEDIPDRVQQLQALNLLVLLLPVGHRDTLQLLLSFLCHVISKKKDNKMDLNNVAMIMAPNLFLNTGNKGRASLREVEMAKGTINIVRMLIKYHAILWTVPSFMVRQIRYLYEVEQMGKSNKDIKSKKRKAKKTMSNQLPGDVTLLRTQSLEDLDRIEQEFENHIIRVKAPTLNKVGMAVQLSEKTTARDVVEKFCKDPTINKTRKNTGHSHRGNKCPCGSNHFLYEVGGNIGQRCLDFETNLLQLSRINPHAEWVVKRKE